MQASRIKSTLLTLSLSLGGLLSINVSAEAIISAGQGQNKGLEISKKAKEKDLGWTDSQTDLEMILKNQHGQTSVRKMHLKSLEIEGDGDKSLTVFDSPRDVKGTAFLSFSHLEGNDDQWLYLPALKQVRRISSRNKTGSFMSSEFSFEDLTSFEIEKYSYNYLRDEMINGDDTWVVEQFPLDKYSGYKRRIVWIDKSEYRTVKTEFYDRKDSLLKTLTLSKFHLYLDKYWRPEKMEMINHQSGKSTILNYTTFKIKQGLSDKDFNRNALKRAR